MPHKESGAEVPRKLDRGECAKRLGSLAEEGAQQTGFMCPVSRPAKAPCHFLLGRTCPAGPAWEIYSLSISHLKNQHPFFLHSFSTTPSSLP